MIVDFGLQDVADKIIYEYEDIKGEPHAVKVGNINPYLSDVPNLVIMPRTTPICYVSPMINSRKPTDGGNLVLSEVDVGWATSCPHALVILFAWDGMI